MVRIPLSPPLFAYKILIVVNKLNICWYKVRIVPVFVVMWTLVYANNLYKTAQLMTAGFTTREVASRFKVTERTIRRWQQKPEFNAVMTRFNNNRSVLISKLPNQLSIASLNWTLNYINDTGGNANVRIKIF